MDTGSPLFSKLNQNDIALISRYGVSRVYPKNTLLIHKGDESDSLYIIQEGQVKVYVSDELGNEVILRYQGPGEYFGELALIDEKPRSASVSTVVESRLYYVSRARFEDCLRDNPEVSLKLIREMIERIRVLTEALADCALKNVYQRIRSKLTQMAVEKDGQYVIEQPLTHQEIAGLVGSGREMVSRVLKKLQDGEYISVRKKHIAILKKLPRNLPS